MTRATTRQVSTRAYIALGSNLGDRADFLNRALDMLARHADMEVASVSSFHETDPVGPIEQPRFLNAAAAIDTTLSARELLTALQEIERALGRDRRHEEKWGPRTIDLDLLLFGDAVIGEPDLTIPHPRMAERLFVLEPLAEIAPEAVHPTACLTVQKLCLQARAERKGAKMKTPSRTVVHHRVTEDTEAH